MLEQQHKQWLRNESIRGDFWLSDFLEKSIDTETGNNKWLIQKKKKHFYFHLIFDVIP